MSRERLLTTACWLATSTPLLAQDPAPGPLAPRPMQPVAQSPVLELVKDVGMIRTFLRDDYYEVHLNAGFRLWMPEQRLEIRGDNALLMTDVDAFRDALGERQQKGLPRRGIDPPDPRRYLSNDAIRERLSTTLQAIGRSDGLPEGPVSDRALETLRYLYCEGGIVIVRDGVEVLRCDRLWISPVDDRVVVENAELRYFTTDQGPGHLFVVRGPKLTRQGRRWTGRDLTITTCTAGEPHAAVHIDDAEIIERDGEFEIVGRGQTLQIGGTSVLPLPNTHLFTGSQGEFPIKRVRAGYSNNLGYQGEVVLGLPWNKSGGALHQWLTGRPANEFRGDWEVGVGWIQARGVPLDGAVRYRAGKLYEGMVEGFWLDDGGRNLREIRTGIDGITLDDTTRSLLHTQNRVRLGETTNLDLVAYKMSDEAVWSEFFSGYYRSVEVPETSTYLHHGDGNRLLTVGSRFNLNDFSYRDDRALSPRFVEELPVVTYQWLAQPIGETPWSTPVVVDLATEIGQRRSAYDDLAGVRESDRTLRLDQLAEVSAPFHALGLNVRPYGSARGTFYDETVDGGSEGRIAMESGVQFGTSMSRSWKWLDGEDLKGVRHVASPKITYRNRFHVDDTADQFFVFDDLDTLREQQLVRVELRNQLQRMEKVNGVTQPRDFVFADIAQDFFPDKARDNQGEGLGLLYYDLLIRPPQSWSPFQTFTYALYGDHDWKTGLRTFETELQFGPVLGLGWGLDYRTDSLVSGAVGLGVSTQLLDRWSLYVQSQRDIENDEWLTYAFGLTRNDHDWSITLSAIYNPFADETTFRIDFLPRLGGINRTQRDRLGNGTIIGPMNAPH